MTSIKGKHQFDFESLVSTGELFAITGQTGSGKSTLLNCISVALFNKVYKGSLKPQDLVSLGQSEGKIKLHFQYKNKNYSASWSCRKKKKNGETLKNPIIQKTLKDPEGELIESSEDLFGLGFEQFCRTVILGQSDFATFLTSNFSGRRALLEKYTEGTLLKDLNTVLLAISRKGEIELAKSSSALETIEAPNEEDFERLKASMKDTQLEVIKKDQSLKKLNNLINALSEIIRLSQDYKNAETKLNNLIKTKKESEDFLKTKNLEYIKKKDNWLKQEPLLQERQARLKQSLVDREKLQELKDKLLLLSSNHKDLTQKKDTIYSEIPGQREKVKQLEEFIKKSPFYAYFSEIKDFNKAEEFFIEIQNFEKDFQLSLKEIKDLENQILEIKKPLKILLEKRNEQFKNEQLKLDLDNKKKELIIFESQQEEYLNIQNQISEINRDLKKLCAKEESPHFKDLENHLTKEILTTYKKIGGDTLLTLHQHREKHKKCPICFHDSNNGTSLSQEAIAELQQYSDNKKKIVDLNKVQEEKTKVLRTLEKKVNENKQKDIKAQLQGLTSKYEESLKISNEIDFIKKGQTELQRSLEIKLNIHQTIKDKRATKGAILNKHYPGLWEIILKNKEIENSLEDLRKFKEHLNNQKLLQSQENTYDHYCKQLKEISDDKLFLESQIAKMQENLEENTTTEEIHQSLQVLSETIRGTLDQIQKAQLELSEKEKEVSQLRGSVEQLTNWKEDQERLIKSCILKITPEYKEKSGKDISPDNWSRGPEILKIQNETFQKEYTEELQAIDHFKSEAAKLEERFKVATQAMDKHSGLMKQHIRNEKLSSRAQVLKDLLGREEFRNFILSQIEERILYYANFELRSLCQGRYQLLLETDKNEFLIEDKNNFNQKRKVSTLSGGETFLVSIALSLALSELNKGNSQMETFIIDEGFGSLDEQTLDEVMDIFSDLQKRGRQIGVISHIPALKNRIQNRIDMDRFTQLSFKPERTQGPTNMALQ